MQNKNSNLLNWSLTLGKAALLSLIAGNIASVGLPWRLLHLKPFALVVGDQREGYGGPEVGLEDRLLDTFDLVRGIKEEDLRLHIGLALTILGVLTLKIDAIKLASDLQIMILLLFLFVRGRRGSGWFQKRARGR